MLYAFDGSPSLDKVAYMCPGNCIFMLKPFFVLIIPHVC
jgi:hypothetical protein